MPCQTTKQNFTFLGLIAAILNWGHTHYNRSYIKPIQVYTAYNLYTVTPQPVGPTNRIMEGCGNRASCRSLFKKFHILPLKSQYMLSLLLFVVKNKTLFLTNTENYNLDTRQKKKNNLHLPQANLTIYQKELIIWE